VHTPVYILEVCYIGVGIYAKWLAHQPPANPPSSRAAAKELGRRLTMPSARYIL
jgi:hypothetical protein